MSLAGFGGTDPGAPAAPNPEADEAFEGRVYRVAEEKQRARDAPDLPWRTWWFHSGSKWYLGLAFLVVDVWILDGSYDAGYLAFGLVGCLAALYAEFLLYRYLYYVPDLGDERRPGRFRPSWTRPAQYGRWTPEGEAVRAGGTVVAAEPGPDPKEFL